VARRQSSDDCDQRDVYGHKRGLITLCAARSRAQPCAELVALRALMAYLSSATTRPIMTMAATTESATPEVDDSVSSCSRSFFNFLRAVNGNWLVESFLASAGGRERAGVTEKTESGHEKRVGTKDRKWKAPVRQALMPPDPWPQLTPSVALLLRAAQGKQRRLRLTGAEAPCRVIVRARHTAIPSRAPARSYAACRANRNGTALPRSAQHRVGRSRHTGRSRRT